MDGIRATPYQRPMLGGVNELIGGLLGYMRDPRRTQQLQGLAGLLESTGIPKTVERMAYGEPLTNVQMANVPLLRPETAEAALTLLPVPPAANKAAMSVGRAGERVAERVVPRIMERGGLPAGLLESMSSQTVSPLTVYHGSPAKFSRFDPTKIGSGEGAQAYGYGHYVAQSPATAEQYKEMLKSKQFSKIIQNGRNDYSVVTKDGDVIANNVLLGQAHKEKNAFDAKVGSVYEIDLPDEQIAKMVSWDRPIKEQSKEIQDIAKSLGLEMDDLGGDIIARMDAKRPEGAERLRQAGIPGIRYFDAQSRGGQQATTENFVVFPGNEDLLTILRRNGGLLD